MLVEKIDGDKYYYVCSECGESYLFSNCKVDETTLNEKYGAGVFCKCCGIRLFTQKIKPKPDKIKTPFNTLEGWVEFWNTIDLNKAAKCEYVRLFIEAKAKESEKDKLQEAIASLGYHLEVGLYPGESVVMGDSIKLLIAKVKEITGV